MIDGRSSSTSGRRLIGTKEDQDVGEPDDLRVAGADLDERSAERIDEKFLLGVQIGGVQMVMAIDDRSVLGRDKLGGGR